MRVLLVTVVAVAAVAAAAGENYYRLPAPYTYSCRESRCIKQERGNSREHQSLETCQLTCGQYGSLWPQPTGEVQLSSETVNFSPRNIQEPTITAANKKVEQMLHEAYRIFTRNIHYLHPDFPKDKKKPNSDEDEEDQVNQIQYKLRVNPTHQQRFNQQQQQQQEIRFPFIDRRTGGQYLKYSPFLRERNIPGVERQQFRIHITVTSPEDKLTIDTDEHYKLQVRTVDDNTTAKIEAATYYGARHGLESLSQLIAFDDVTNSLQIVSGARVEDKPEFKYRGFMLDTGRNFYPKEDIMSLLDAMSYNKMNYFHWHITDAASFPMYSNRVPDMAYYGAYSPRKVYYPEDIQQIVQYAKLRGINVIPELDGPAHTSAGWQWGEKEGKGKLVLCTGENEPWFSVGKEPPAGQFNPVNPELYPVLGEIYRDMMDYFDPEMVHMGGDDVSFKCWENDPQIKEYMAANSLEGNTQQYMELWNTYQTNAYSKLQQAAGQGRKVTPIIHSSSFARNYVDKNNYIIQINEFANDNTIADYVNNGYKIILSNQDQWRLDCSGSIWVGDKANACARETPTWQHFYENSPLDILYNLGVTNARSELPATGDQPGGAHPKDLVLGGEATMWSSETDGNGLQAKAWPRVSAMAERLWTDSKLPIHATDIAQKRLDTHRQRMVYRGIRADPIQPEYCMHNEAACYTQEQFQARTGGHAAVPAS